MPELIGVDPSLGHRIRLVHDGCVVTSVERIEGPPGDRSDPILAPALRDLQVNGCLGISFSDPALTVAAVGPGFSNIQLGSGPNRLYTDRRDGAYYEENLQRALDSGRQILVIETWNELGEASGILETVEYGRQYIDLTRRYADQFKQAR